MGHPSYIILIPRCIVLVFFFSVSRGGALAYLWKIVRSFSSLFIASQLDLMFLICGIAGVSFLCVYLLFYPSIVVSLLVHGVHCVGWVVPVCSRR